MRSFALSSGSSANCFYIESNLGVKVLVDLGLSYSKTEEILSERGIDIQEINAICITHEHSDHIIGLKTFASRLNCPIYISKGTFEEASGMSLNEKSDKFKIIKNHSNFNVEDLKVFVVGKPHDAKEAVSFVFDDTDKKLGVFTDLGHVTNEIKHVLKTLDVVYFEANYCEEYVGKIKDSFNSIYLNRLMSNVGHLGLHQTCEALIETANNTQKIILSHISENTNSYENTYRKVSEALREVSLFPQLVVSFQGEPTDWM